MRLDRRLDLDRSIVRSGPFAPRLAMIAIYRGHRYYVVSSSDQGVSLTSIASSTLRVHVPVDDPDLIVEPTCEDLHLAEAFERGEVGAFEYPDGHTYPPNQEIAGRPRGRRESRVH